MTTEISETISVQFDNYEPEECTIASKNHVSITLSEKEAIRLAYTILNQYFGI